MTRTLVALALLAAACRTTEPTPTTDPTTEPGTTTSSEPTGGVSVLTGIDGAELASAFGPGDRCGDDPPLPLSDLDDDGTIEVGLLCRTPDASVGSARDLHVLSGAALLDGGWTAAASIELRTDGVQAVGDLDGDGTIDLGHGLRTRTLTGVGEVDWWTLRTGSSLLGEPVEVSIQGDGTQYGSGAPLPLDDVDGDGVDDLLVWQSPGSEDPVISVVSGSAAIAGGVSVLTGAWRRIHGLSRDEIVDDAAAGLPGEVWVVIGDRVAQYDQDQVSVAVRIAGDDLLDPANTTRIAGTTTGRDRYGQVEPLGDLDGDGLPDVAVLLTTFSSSQQHHADLAVIPGAAAQVAGALDPSPWRLALPEGLVPRWLEACDLDGDGLPELVSDGGTWDGRDLLRPGAAPVGPPIARAACAGDLDGQPGDELLVGLPDAVP